MKTTKNDICVNAETTGVKLTVGNVAKATFTIALGIKMGLYYSETAYVFIKTFNNKLDEWLYNMLENLGSSKKASTDYESEFDAAVENMEEVKEGESES